MHYQNGKFLKTSPFRFFTDAEPWRVNKHRKIVLESASITRAVTKKVVKHVDGVDVNECLKLGGVYIFKVPTGAGKTSKIAKPAFYNALESDENVAVIAPLIAICQNYVADARQATKIPVQLYSDLTYENLDAPGLATTINSICKPHVSHKLQGLGLVIVEEAQKTLDTLSESDDLMRGRESIYRKLLKVIGDSTTVFLLDADANDSLVDFCREAGREPVVVEMPADHSDITAELVAEQRLLEKVKRALSKNRRVVIAVDSKAQAEALAEIFKAKTGLMLLHAENKDKKRERFLRSPNQYLKNVRLLIYTPVMGSSVSIEYEHFDEHFGIFSGVIPPLYCVQMLRRDRTAKKFTICVKGSQFVPSLETVSKNQHLPIIHQIRVQNDYLRQSIATSLELTLEYLKFDVVRNYGQLDKPVQPSMEVRAAKSELKKLRVNQILHAQIIDLNLARKLKYRADLSSAEIAARDAAFVRDICGEVTRDAVEFWLAGGEFKIQLHRIMALTEEMAVNLDGGVCSVGHIFGDVDFRLDGATFEMARALLLRLYKTGREFDETTALRVLNGIRKSANWNRIGLIKMPRTGSLSPKVAAQIACKIYKKLGYSVRNNAKSGGRVIVKDDSKSLKYIKRALGNRFDDNFQDGANKSEALKTSATIK